MNKGIFVFAFILIIATSCDCPVHHSGYVYDSKTMLPIQHAIVTFDEQEFRTDENGYFSIDYMSGFCPDEHYFVDKEGFKPFDLKIDREKDRMIYTVAKQNETIKLNTPIIIGDSTTGLKLYETSINLKSKDFEIRSDTLIFYLEEKNRR